LEEIKVMSDKWAGGISLSGKVAKREPPLMVFSWAE
jgi:hypothetical protein